MMFVVLVMMYMKTITGSIFAIVAAVSLVTLGTFAAPALAYKDHDHDDSKDLKQFNYCVKHHDGGRHLRVQFTQVCREISRGSLE